MNVFLFILCVCMIGWVSYKLFKILIYDDPDCGWRKLEEEVESLRDYTDKYK